MELTGLIIWAVCIWGCYKLAKDQGRNTTLAIVWGILFGWIALVVYALLMIAKRKEKTTDMGIDA